MLLTPFIKIRAHSDGFSQTYYLTNKNIAFKKILKTQLYCWIFTTYKQYICNNTILSKNEIIF